MVASVASGSISATSTETQFAAAQTAGAVYQLVVDANAMAAGDEYLVRLYSKARAADAERLEGAFRFFGPQGSEIMKRFPPIATDCHFRATIQKVAGADRAFAWSINTL